VIGIDDIEEGRFSAPSLSTVAPDKRAIAETAIDLLLGSRAQEGVATTVVGHHLVVRESTGGAGGTP
jgi:DNA-binding LacI/PurR family transcriptional regulator